MMDFGTAQNRMQAEKCCFMLFDVLGVVSMKEKRIMIRLSKDNAQWLEAWRQRFEVPVSLTYLTNRALSEQAEFYAKMKFNITNNKKGQK